MAGRVAGTADLKAPSTADQGAAQIPTTIVRAAPTSTGGAHAPFPIFQFLVDESPVLFEAGAPSTSMDSFSSCG